MTYTQGTFNFHGNEIRVISNSNTNTVWFVAFDVANLLEYKDTHAMLQSVDDDEKTLPTKLTGLQSDLRVNAPLISESALYDIVIRSNKQVAKPFRKWVTGEVLPQIRRTGAYSIEPVAPTLEQKYIILLEENRALRKQLNDVLSPAYLTAREMLSDATGLPVEQISRSQVMTLVKMLPDDIENVARSSGKRYIHNNETLILIKAACRINNMPVIRHANANLQLELGDK